MPEDREQLAIREGYEYAQILTEGIAEAFPDGEVIDIRDEIQWGVEQVSDDPEERAELLPYVAFGFRQGTVDRLFGGENRYELSGRNVAAEVGDYSP